jgi:hypothetical protein
MNQPMPALSQRRRNGALLGGTLFIVLAILSYIPYFVFLNFPGETILTWVSMLLPALGVVFFIVGLKRAFGQREMYRGKILGSILGGLSLLLFGLSIFSFAHARDLPGSAGAPRIGQKAPDFTLTDSSGNSVTLSQMLIAPIDAASGKAPKAVLLVFYRGNW